MPKITLLRVIPTLAYHSNSLSAIYSDFLRDIISGILSASILTFYLADIYSGILSGI